MNLSEHFTLEEMTVSQTATRKQIDNTPSDKNVDNLKRTCALLEQVRELFEKPITINSGYRSPTVNACVGGKPNSQHVNGCAADFIIRGMSLDDVMDGIITADLPYDQLIREFDSWVHISVSNQPSGVPRKEALIIDHSGTRVYA